MGPSHSWRDPVMIDHRAGEIMIVGGSKGLGHGLSCGFPEFGDKVWLVSRSRPPSLERRDGVNRVWIQADLSDADSVKPIVDAIAGVRLRLLIYSAGIWESHRDLESIDDREIYRILNVNTSGFIAVTRALTDNLGSAENARIVAIGSTAGLDNATGPRAAYAASKFGLRGAVHSLRRYFEPMGIGVTCLSVGGLASEMEFDEGIDAVIKRHGYSRIPTADIVTIVRCIVALSPAACVKEIQLPAMDSRDA